MTLVPVNDHAVSTVVTVIQGQESIAALKSYWVRLSRFQRPIADDPRVIEAKDTRKAELIRAKETVK